MTRFAELAALCRRLEQTGSRLEIETAVAFLTGRVVPVSDPRVLGVRGLPRVSAPSEGEPLELDDVRRAFGAIAEATGAGSRQLRQQHLLKLALRASEDERVILHRIIGGEMRTGVSEGVMLEALGALAGGDVAAVRRAALFLGDLSAVAAIIVSGGAGALTAVEPRPFVPLLPMLAEIATAFDDVLAAHAGVTALEFKYDGARMQLHRDGDRVQVWTRRLSDVTRSVTDVVEVARRDLTGAPFILDGEVVALDAEGRPLAFQELMRRFRRVHAVEQLLGEMPLALHFFDCLMADGRSLIDRPYAERWEELTRVTAGRYLAERAIVSAADEALRFRDRAIAAGHEGVVAKDLRSSYEPGGRGKRWFKLKVAETVDCVIIAADRGSGRRVGWLSNYHLAVRDGERFADVGKTFKGLTDAEFVQMTERLWKLAEADDGYTVRVRPEVVVEVEYNEIQRSPTYPSGLALRFARIARIRDDKAPGQATTLPELQSLYERQFRTKGMYNPSP